MQEFTTPMMKQYMGMKKQYQDCLLFFRAGDFYELFLEDAHIGSKVLNITLTHKRGGKDGNIPMAGVPFHAIDTYLAKLVKAGYKVAICEQVSLPNKYGIIDREVVRIVTPGTVLDENALEKKENNFIVSLAIEKNIFALSAADLSTGYFSTMQTAFENVQQTIQNELSRLHPSECILPEELYNNPEILKMLKTEKGLNIYCFQEWYTYADNPKQFLKNHFGIVSLMGFAIEDKYLALQSSAALLGYLQTTQKTTVKHIKKIATYTNTDCVLLDRSTITNLELFSTIREHDSKGTLLFVLDQTHTAMGGRMLKDWIRKPLTKKEDIEKRYDVIEALLENSDKRLMLQESLKGITDIERVLSRLSVNIGNARDLVNLKEALKLVLVIKDLLALSVKRQALSVIKKTHSLLQELHAKISPDVQTVITIIDTHIVDEPPIDLRSGGIIKHGIHKELDTLRKTVGGSKEWILQMEKKERERTGISSLKIRFNQVFGFYIEVSKTNLHLIPDNYLRKQTLVNGERFITTELKEQEEIILTAEEKINQLEYQIFIEVLEKILQCIEPLQEAAQSIAVVDCLVNFSELAEKNRYTRPIIANSGEITITQGRHPVVEKLLEDNQFVPNDLALDNNNQQLLLITGPNMAGKSVFIRQVALIVLMAQIGCFVPADKAHISLVDRIFVRSGASDVITSGLSTFMMEMVETAHILHHATKDSLIIMDEIGRGTSTYDGISIAWAVAEYLVRNWNSPARNAFASPACQCLALAGRSACVASGPKTLFATHYHELQALEKDYPNKIKNFHMAVADDKGEPVFLHTILPGGASHSFGVAVAKLAGIPEPVIQKAKEMLQNLEKRNLESKDSEASSYPPSLKLWRTSALPPTTIINALIQKELLNIDLHQMTPLEALNKLAELKEKIKAFQTMRQGEFLEVD